MNDRSKALRWLDHLEPLAGEDDPVVVYSAAPSAAASGSLLHDDPRHLDDFWPIAAALEAKAARPGPLVLLTDVAEDPGARAVAASKLARLLSESGRRILLVDADFDRDGLSVVLGPTEQEGLVDLLLYGASVAATCRPSGLDGVDVLPVGSFRPEGSEEFEDEVLHRAFAQLRASYDLVLTVAPARLPNGRFNGMLVHADGILLAPSATDTDPESATEFLRYLAGQVLPVWGVVGFASEDVVAERPLDRVEPAPEPPSESPGGGPELDLSKVPEPTVHRFEEDVSSPLFRRLTIGLGVILIGFLGWWGWTQLMAPPAREPVAAQVAAEAVRKQAEEVSPDPPAEGADPAESSPDQETPVADAGAPPGGSAEPSEGGDETPVEVAEIGDPGVSTTADPASPGPETPPDGPSDDTPPAPAETDEAADPGENLDEPFEEEESTPVVTPPPPATPVREASPPTPELARLRDLARAAPGGGWSLHPWSFPDSLEAVAGSRGLVRDGYAPRVVSAVIPGKGLWYRVVVGSFPRRSDAMAARSILGQRPDVEYVGVVRVP